MNKRNKFGRGEDNMKKAIAILLVVLVAGVAFGANPTANLTITTKLKGVEGIKLSTTFLTKNTYGTAGADETLLFESLDEVTAPTAQTAYINLRTNKANAYTINLSGRALISANVATTIGYVLTPVAGTGYTVGSPLTVAKDDTTADITVDSFVTYTADSTSGLRVVPAEFSVLLTEADWLAATAANDYTTTVKVEVVAGT